MAERGLGAVSLAAVAAQAGVSGGRVQHYFRTKQELIEAAFERANQLATARIEAHSGIDDPGVLLRVVLTQLIPHDAVTELHMRVRQSFTALGLADDAIAARLRSQYADLHRRLAELIAAEQAGGCISAGTDPHAAAASLVALAEGLAYYVLIGVTPAKRAHEAVLTALERLHHAG